MECLPSGTFPEKSLESFSQPSQRSSSADWPLLLLLWPLSLLIPFLPSFRIIRGREILRKKP